MCNIINWLGLKIRYSVEDVGGVNIFDLAVDALELVDVFELSFELFGKVLVFYDDLFVVGY